MNNNTETAKKYYGQTILYILTLLPVFFWLIQKPISQRFSNLNIITLSLGQVSGLVGMALFSLAMILSARLKIFERVFNGVNSVYVDHHFIGGIAFSLLLIHPLLLAYTYLLISFKEAALFLLPSVFWPQNYGIIALCIMIIALVITFYMTIKYQVWKFSHKFLGLAFVFAFVHMMLIGSDIALNQPLKIYLFVLGMLGVTSFFYRALFNRFFVRRLKYVVNDIVSLPDNTIEIEATPKDKALNFIPGQFVFMNFVSKNVSNEYHPFSISSASGNPIRIAIKELGDYTNKIKNIQKGDLINIEGPYGNFNFKNYSKKQTWIAGGIGITPFMSMLRYIKENNSDYDIDLYYSVKDESGLIFKDEIEKIALDKKVNVVLWRSNINGFISAQSIKDKTKDLLDRDILICGPLVMMTALKKQFVQLGVKRNKIHSEEFQLY